MWRLFLSTRCYGSQVLPAQSLATRCDVVLGGGHCQEILRQPAREMGWTTLSSGWRARLAVLAGLARRGKEAEGAGLGRS